MAGDVSFDAAEALAGVVRRELDPVLQQVAVSAAERSTSVDEELRKWGGLLYKPAFTSSLALNACLDPGLARALDQCGGI